MCDEIIEDRITKAESVEEKTAILIEASKTGCDVWTKASKSIWKYLTKKFKAASSDAEKMEILREEIAWTYPDIAEELPPMAKDMISRNLNAEEMTSLSSKELYIFNRIRPDKFGAKMRGFLTSSPSRADLESILSKTQKYIDIEDVKLNPEAVEILVAAAHWNLDKSEIPHSH